MEGAVVVHAGEPVQAKLGEEPGHPHRVVDAVCVELDPLPSDGQANEQRAARGKHPLELQRRLRGSVGIELVPVAAETDVLGHVQARERLQRAVGEGQGQHAAHLALETRKIDLEPAKVDEGDRHEGREADRKRYPRSHIHVTFGGEASDLPCRPAVLEGVVGLERRGLRAIEQLGQILAATQRRSARQRGERAPVGQEARIPPQGAQDRPGGDNSLDVTGRGEQGGTEGPGDTIAKRHAGRDAMRLRWSRLPRCPCEPPFRRCMTRLRPRPLPLVRASERIAFEGPRQPAHMRSVNRRTWIHVYFSEEPLFSDHRTVLHWTLPAGAP